MSRLISPAIVIFLVASSPAFDAVAAQSYVAATTELAIDGVSCGRLYSVEGGDPRARAVVVSNSGGTTLPKKQITGIRYEPITVEVALPPAQPILDWIGDLCANRQTRKTLLLTKHNANGQAVGTPLQAINTLLTEVRFPAFDAVTKDEARLTLVFTPESTQATTAVAATSTSGAKSSATTLSNFRIQIGTLPASRVSRIESITIKQPVAENIVGSTKQSVQTVGITEFSNLVLTINTIDIAGWNTWRDSFVVKGTNDDASEMSGSLELLATDMKTTLLTLEFSHVGIVRASPGKETPTDSLSRFQAELYCESMAIGTAPARPLTALPVAPATATMGAPPPTTPAASAPAALTPVTTVAPTPAQIATLMPAPASTLAGSSTAGGAAAGAASSSAAGGGAAQATASPAGSAAAGGASASSAGSAAAGGAAAGAAGSPSGSSVAGAASGASAGSAAAGGAAGATVTPATNSTAGVAPASSAGSAVAGGGAASGGGAAGAETAPTPATTSSADQGARDPKDFPRLDGTVRKSYSSVRQMTYTQEIVAYSSKSTPDALEELYTKSLTAAGWKLNTRVENNNSIWNTHQIVLNWVNALRSVTITLAEVKTGGVEIGVNLTTKFAP